MKGTVYKRGDTWTYQVTLGTKKRGRKHHSKGGFRTQKECQSALTILLADLGRGDRRRLQKSSNLTVSEWLDEWLELSRHRPKRPLKATTLRGYRSLIDARIKPHIGDVRLTDLGRNHLLSLYGLLRERGGPGGRPLGSKSVQATHALLRKALADAVAFDHIMISPVDSIPADYRPTHTSIKRSDAHWEPEQVRRFLEHTKNDRIWVLWALGFDSGARRGELLALRWSKVDLDSQIMTIDVERVVGERGKVVEDTPKSATSVREVNLSDGTVAALRRWRKAQLQERLAAGEWHCSDDPYVIANELGVPYRPETLSDWFDRDQANLGLPRITFHGMRHTSGSILLAAGEHLHVVSERLGHASVSITADVYAHALKGQKTEAARRIGEALYGSG